MKKLVFSLAFTAFFAGASSAQNGGQVNYKITKDDPSDIVNFWLVFDPFHFDFGFKNIDGTSFNLGLWGIGMLNDRLGFDYTARRAWLTMGNMTRKDKLRAHYQVEAGGYLNLGSSTKSKTRKLVLKSETSYRNGKEYETTTFINVPMTVKNVYQARAGVFSIGGFYGLSDYTLPVNAASYSSTGIYVGLGNMNIINTFVNTDSYGKKNRSVLSRVFVDVLIAPLNGIQRDGISYKKDVNPSPIGARLGWQVLRASTKDEQKRGGMQVTVEIGARPFDGFYMAGSVGFPILRKKLPGFAGGKTGGRQATFD